MENFDGHIVMNLCPGFKRFISTEGIRFLAQKVKMRISGAIISECGEITISTKSFNGRGSPHIRVDFVTEGFSMLPLVYLRNCLATALCVTQDSQKVGSSPDRSSSRPVTNP